MKKNNISMHDKFFKLSMHEFLIAKDFISSYVSDQVKSVVDWSSLELQSGSFIDVNYKAFFTDVLFKVKFSGRLGYFYILTEHQSTPDKLMPFRLLQYMFRIWERHLSKYKTELLPIVYPITLYHGKIRPYPFSMDFFDSFQEPDLARSILIGLPFQLVDLTQKTDDELEGHGYAAVMELVQRHIYDGDLLPLINKLSRDGLLSKIEPLNGGNYVLNLIEYVLESGEFSSADEMLDVFVEAFPSKEKEIMTGAEYLRQQGMQQGMQQGVESVAKNMLSKGMDPAIIADVTGLSPEKLSEINS